MRVRCVGSSEKMDPNFTQLQVYEFLPDELDIETRELLGPNPGRFMTVKVATKKMFGIGKVYDVDFKEVK